MATIKIRYLKPFARAAGRPPRWFWQPAKALREEGWRMARLDDNRDLAMQQAESINAVLDQWRLGRAPALPDAPELRRAVEAAAPPALLHALGTDTAPGSKRSRRPAPGTFKALVASYKTSRFWTKLSPRTHRSYDQCIAILEEWAGDRPVAALNAPTIQAFYEAMHPRRPAYANATVRVLRLLLQHAVRSGQLAHNPAAQPGLIGDDSSAAIWPRIAVDLFVEQADAMGLHSIGDAVLLDEWIGQRQGDVLRLPANVYRDGTLRFRQSKTGAGAILRIGDIPRLVNRLEQATARRLAIAKRPGQIAATTLIVSEATGQPYKADHFRHTFADVRAALEENLFGPLTVGEAPAGVILVPDPGTPRGRQDLGRAAFDDPDLFDPVPVANLLFMHLRHTAVVRLAEANVSLLQISAVTGHTPESVARIIRRYFVATGKMTEEAFKQRLLHETAGA